MKATWNKKQDKTANITGSKLTEGSVRTIKLLLKRGWTRKKIAELFGVNKGTIGNIKQGRTWKHIQSNKPELNLLNWS